MTTDAVARIAVISDIHGNLHALNAVLDAIDAMDIRAIVCLGDVVGYGAFPNECCELLRFRRIPTVVGNHDHAVIDKTDIRYFNDIAKAAVYWTQTRLDGENIRWLSQLELTHEMDDCLFVHSTPHLPERWGYVLTFVDARLSFAAFGQRFCFVGHSHQPSVIIEHGSELVIPEGVAIPLCRDCRYLVNAGSVGQPRDHNPNACFVTLDRENDHLEYHRVEYDVAAAQQAIRDNNLPVELAERLGCGW